MIGIYCIRNKVNNKIYIGQSCCIGRRWTNHKIELRTRVHSNGHLQNAWNKYGAKSFEFFILTECKEEELNEREMILIKLYDSCNPSVGYNLTSGGEGGRHSPETIQKMRENQLGEKNTFYGHKHTEETKEKWKLSRVAKKGPDNSCFGRKKSTATSKYMGVTKRKYRFEAMLTYDGKTHYLGSFKTEIEAAKARDKKAIEKFGDKAKLNFPL